MSKTKKTLAIVIVLALLITLVVFGQTNLLPVSAENQITIELKREYANTLSVLESGQLIQSVLANVYLNISYDGVITSTVINGQIQILFDSALKESTPLTSPQITASGQKYSLASLTITNSQIQSWASQFGTHILKALIPSGTTLTVTFSDGYQEIRTYGEASATLTLNIQSDSGIIVADITVEPGSQSSPTPTPTPTSTPTPTPTPTASPPSSTNLALPFKAATWEDTTGWGYLTAEHPQLIYFDDNNVLHNGHPSIRMEPHTSADGNTARELNNNPFAFAVNEGDHVVFKCWMKTGQSQNMGSRTDVGARIGIDFYGATGNLGIGALVNGVGSDTNHIVGYLQADGSFVPWNTATWTQLTIDFTVPSGYGITCIAPWCQVLPATEPAFAWFSDAELYINPSSASPSPSPASNTNLAIPFQSATNLNGNVGWGWWQVPNDIIYSDDTSVEHTAGKPSIKLGWHVNGVDNNIYREIDGWWIPVNAGDHIVFSVWIKTQSGGTNAGDNGNGGRIGIDLYGYKDGVSTGFAWYPQYAANSAVPWGRDWTKQTLDVVVPSDIYGSINPWNGQPYTIHSTGPYGIIAWCDVRTTTDQHYVWFADAELYINP
jgi:hypothetical protein